jgi:hypothetical protein
MDRRASRRSAAIVTCRAAIMLTALVAIPCFALFRMPLLELVRSAPSDLHGPGPSSGSADGHGGQVSRLWHSSPEISGRLTEATAFEPVRPPEASSDLSVSGRGFMAEFPASGTGDSRRTAESGTTKLSPSAPGSAGGTPEMSGFEALEAELRQSGATYYFLERVGPQYRFFCRAEGFLDPLEAWGTDATTTMRQVLHEIRARRPHDVQSPVRFASPLHHPRPESDAAPSTATRPRVERSGR